MSEARKGKEQNPFQGRLEAQLKSKGASLPTPLDYGARKMLSRVKMNAQPRGALDSFSRAGAPVLSLFHLTRAVVVIHGMTISVDEANSLIDRIISPRFSFLDSL